MSDSELPEGIELEELLEFLRDSRSLDFTGYKRPSLSRRIRKRMEAVDVATFDAYRDYLEVHPDEHTDLVDTILINVTSFFRDEEAWKYLANEIVPAITAGKARDEPIRIWSAGCATGEEAYTLAMVFADHLGMDDFKARVKIYATDTDEQALTQARSGIYTAAQLEAVPADKRERFFEPVGDRFAFRPDCRRSVIFGNHDITRDAPISRLDLLVCRNVLMYLIRDAQRRALGRFHYALGDHGYLFLGKAETIFAHADLFTATSAGFRIFSRADQPPPRQQLHGMAVIGSGADAQLLQDLASAATPVAQLVVDVDGLLVGANTKARSMFGVSNTDLGRPFQDLEVSFRPIELRSRMEQAYAESRPVLLREVDRVLADGQQQYLEGTVAPLADAAGRALGISITFADVTELGRAKVDLERSAREIELANESLHSANEELETSNEELQSTNEELETTNEELQSANEELETMNEELQSANEELETMNEELLEQATQIEASGQFLTALVNSLTVGVVVVDDDLNVVVWNRAMEDLFGVRTEEAAGRSLLALDIGAPVGEIGPLLHAARSTERGGDAEVFLDAVNRKGQPFRCRVIVNQLNRSSQLDPVSGDVPSLIVLMDPMPDDAS